MKSQGVICNTSSILYQWLNFSPRYHQIYGWHDHLSGLLQRMRPAGVRAAVIAAKEQVIAPYDTSLALGVQVRDDAVLQCFSGMLWNKEACMEGSNALQVYNWL